MVRPLLALSALLVSVTLAPACQPALDDQHFDIVYDPCEVIVVAPAADTSADELLSIDDALAMWNSTGATRLTRHGRADQPRLAVSFESAAPAFYGLYRDDIGDVVINRSLRDRDARAVTIAHELGHALGLRHPEAGAGDSVMTAGNLDTPPSPSDLRSLELLWGRCPADLARASAD